MSWEERFKSHVRSTAFSLSLTHNQIKILWVCADYPRRRARMFANGEYLEKWCSGFRSLERKGLIEHNPEQRNYKRGDPKPTWTYRLTIAGDSVHRLCEIANLFAEYDSMPIREPEDEII